uniref:Uncharacterized protein n=1 Tax=Caenorhabditis japonica TaxID=281687 RepID=A0A8R1I4V1_CAEJA
MTEKTLGRRSFLSLIGRFCSVVCCIKCNDDVGDLKHFLKCYPVKPLPMSKLWKDPVAAATALGLAVTPFDPGGDADS